MSTWFLTPIKNSPNSPQYRGLPWCGALFRTTIGGTTVVAQPSSDPSHGPEMRLNWCFDHILNLMRRIYLIRTPCTWHSDPDECYLTWPGSCRTSPEFQWISWSNSTVKKVCVGSRHWTRTGKRRQMDSRIKETQLGSYWKSFLCSDAVLVRPTRTCWASKYVSGLLCALIYHPRLTRTSADVIDFIGRSTLETIVWWTWFQLEVWTRVPNRTRTFVTSSTDFVRISQRPFVLQ